MWEGIQATLISMIPVAIGSIITFLGTISLPIFQSRQLKWQAKREDAALYREKASEVFEEVDHILNQSHRALISSLSGWASEAEDKPERIAELGKLRSLVATYFPDCLKLLDNFDAKSGEIFDRMGTAVTGAGKGKLPEADAIRAIRALAVGEHQRLVIKFAKELRIAMTNEVKKHAPSL